MSAMPAWNIAVHLFEGVGEQGVTWLLMHSGLLKSPPPTAGATSLSFEVLPAFDFTSSEYVDLFERAEATAFQHPLWMDRAFARLVNAADPPAILVGRSQSDGRLMLVLPMIRRRLGPFSLLDAADLEVADYNALVFDRSAARNPATVQQVLSALRDMKLVRVRKVRDGAIGLSLCDRSAQIRAMDYQAHEVELATPLEAWQSRLLKPDFARFLKSKRKRLAAKGVVALEEALEPARIRTAFECMRHFRQGRWANDLLADPVHFQFYLDLAVLGSGTGFARTYALTLDGAILAVLFGVYHRGRFCFLLLGFDRQNFRNHSTGLLLLESIIEDCIRRSDNVFDLTIGDEAYKQDFATRSVPMSVLWIGQRPWTQLAPLAFTAAKTARSLFRKLQNVRLKRGES